MVSSKPLRESDIHINPSSGNSNNSPPQDLAEMGYGYVLDDYEDEYDPDAEFYDDEDEDVVAGNPMRDRKLKQNDHEWMFFDVAKINVKGGDGGSGCMAMRREAHVPLGGPCGGNGGDGGSVYLQCDESLNTLSMLRRKVHHRGLSGTNGLGKSMHGRKGDDCHVLVPPGTIVRDEDGVLAGELNVHNQRLLVAAGGRGGRGNEHFKTPRNKAPTFAEKGEEGDERWLNVELKLIADAGLIGVPNAGKSTLLAASSNAKPKIADYQFTTVIPNLGVCDIDVDATTGLGSSKSSSALVLADIPGLLEGAHDGRGLGIAFLRHIQRCRVLLHVIRGDSPDPVGDFNTINQELELFNPRMADKKQVVVVNKIDVPSVRHKLPELIVDLKEAAGHSRVIGVSAVTGETVKDLMSRVRKMLSAMPEQSSDELFIEDDERVTFERRESGRFEVISDEAYPGQYRVEGDKIERIVAMTNWDYYEAAERFQRILVAEGIIDALRKKGAVEGDLVMIGEWDFNYTPKRTRWMEDTGSYDINPSHARPSLLEGEHRSF